MGLVGRLIIFYTESLNFLFLAGATIFSHRRSRSQTRTKEKHAWKNREVPNNDVGAEKGSALCKEEVALQLSSSRQRQ